MANVNRPMGLQPVQYLNGAPYNGAGRVYCIPTTDSTNKYAIGDPVALAGGGDTNGVPTITLATAGTANQLLGVIISSGASGYGGTYGDVSQSSLVVPATKAKNYYVLVETDPNVVYEIQEVGTGTPLAATEIGINANLSSGSDNGTYSGWMLDNSGTAVTATLQLKLLQLAPRVDNAFGAYAKWWVMINNSVFRTGVTGV